ncbi:VOC family protein [Edaphobacter aggregans]|uniref:VOC family protein n=1 Tax=Edaphobacter aggregans TaxID=570835 RepID=UPI0006898593|nr:VOC family protein [Edaphobacter aggregans]
MAPSIEKISAITFRVLNMQASVQFYRKALGMELLYGGEQASFSSLRANDSESAILNLEQGDTVSRWGRLIFHVTDVDALLLVVNRGTGNLLASDGRATHTRSARFSERGRRMKQ